jgi:hypothetical protein
VSEDALRAMGPMPAPGEVYQHAKGHYYVVLGVGVLEDRLRNCVIYQAVNGGQVWVRELTDWSGDYSDGVQRFALLSEEEGRAVLARWPDAPRLSPLSPVSRR